MAPEERYADFSRFGSAVWVDLVIAGREAWTRDGSTVTSGIWREIADLANIENVTGTAMQTSCWVMRMRTGLREGWQ